jgi:Fe-S cluster assembly ATPase SufC
MSKVQIEIDGEAVEIDGELLKEYREESFEFLRKEAEAKRDFKDAVEAQAETLGIDKKILTKYLKSAFKAKTKEQSELGKVFEALDEVSQ